MAAIAHTAKAAAAPRPSAMADPNAPIGAQGIVTIIMLAVSLVLMAGDWVGPDVSGAAWHGDSSSSASVVWAAGSSRARLPCAPAAARECPCHRATPPTRLLLPHLPRS